MKNKVFPFTMTFKDDAIDMETSLVFHSNGDLTCNPDEVLEYIDKVEADDKTATHDRFMYWVLARALYEYKNSQG
jgi:hypothetical protein